MMQRGLSVVCVALAVVAVPVSSVFAELLPAQIGCCALDVAAYGEPLKNEYWWIGTAPVPGGYEIYHGSTKVPGGGVRITSDPNGNPWLLNSDGHVFQWRRGSWQRMPGSGTDIALGGPNSSVWLVSTEPAPGGFKIHQWNGGAWVPVDGGGVRIAVDSTGAAWVVNNADIIFQRVGSTWQQRPGRAKDIAAGQEGIWIVGGPASTGGYGVFQWNGLQWIQQAGAGVAISLGTGNPVLINSDGNVFAYGPPLPDTFLNV